MPLIQEGPRNARIVCVGESPGKKEEQTGRPFIGGSGELFNRILDNVHIPRAEIFITNVCHVRPPGDDFAWFYKKPNQHHYIAGVTQLIKDLAAIKPNVIVAFGNHTMKVLADKFQITKWRGSILPSSALLPGFKVIPTYHPAAALRVYQYKAIIESDFVRIRQQMGFPDIRYPERTMYLPDCIQRRVGTQWETDESPYDRAAIVAEMLQADWLSVDIECWQDKDSIWRMACIGFSDRANRAIVFDWADLEQRQLAIELCNAPMKKVLQNGTFDYTVLADAGVPLRHFVWDTMIGHHTLYMESGSGSDEMAALGKRKKTNPLAKGLGFQTSIYTDEPYYKDDGKLWKQSGDVRTFWRYNGLDAAVTWEIRREQEGQIQRRNLWPAFEHKAKLIHPLMAMTRTGVLVDMEYRNQLVKRYERDIEETTNKLVELAGGPINVKSSKQAQDLLYNRLKLPVQYNKKTKSPTADKFALTALADKYQHPVLLGMLHVREKRTLIEQHLASTIDADGRMRCAFNSTATNTNRLSSSQNIYGTGANLQNIPARRLDGRRIRRMFIADPGQVLIYSDYSQAEARIVAHASRCQALIEVFDDPTRDIHSENAHRIFGIPLEKVGKDSLERFLAKQGVHAGNYGQGPKDLAARINAEAEVTGIRVTERQCAIIQEKVRAIYPEIQENYWREVRAELSRHRRLRGYFGSERVFFDRWDDKLIRSGYAFKPQNAIGELCCKALVNVYYNIQLARPELGVKLLLNIHDALLLECNSDCVREVVELVQKEMNIPVPVNGKDVFIPSDAKVGYNFDVASSENPRGLQSLSKWEAAFGAKVG